MHVCSVSVTVLLVLFVRPLVAGCTVNDIKLKL